MTEATVGDVARGVNGTIVIRTGLRGIPRSLYCRSSDVREEMGFDFETWQLWRAAGLKTHKPGTASEFVYTDDLIDFLRSTPALGPRRSVQRKAADAAKKARKKKGD